MDRECCCSAREFYLLVFSVVFEAVEAPSVFFLRSSRHGGGLMTTVATEQVSREARAATCV